MQGLDLIPVAPELGLSAEPEQVWQSPAKQQAPPEQFADVMGRALTHSSQDDSDNSTSTDTVRREKEKSRPDRRTDSTTHLQTVGAAQVVPPDASSADSPKTSSAPGSSTATVKAVAGAPGSTPTLPCDTTAVGTTVRAAGSAEITSPASQQPDSSKDTTVPEGVHELKINIPADGVAASANIAGLDNLPADKTAPTQKAELADAGVAPDKTELGTAKTVGTQESSIPGAEITGISSAQQQAPMQKAQKTNEISAAAEQKLPAPPAGLTGEELPGKSLHATRAASREEKDEVVSGSGSSGSGAEASSGTASAAPAAVQGSASTPLRSLERTHDMMALHAFRLRDSGSDSLQVVIKPGPGMQISLNLQMRDGNVEVSATMHRGDFDFLKGHWAELQQQLEARGVRVGPLAHGDPTGAGDKNASARSGYSKDERNDSQPGASAVFSLPNPLTQATTTTKAKTLRGWESWA